MLVHEGLTREILGAAIEVHRHLGPGLLTYLQLSKKKVGMLLNFHVQQLVRDGLVRVVL